MQISSGLFARQGDNAQEYFVYFKHWQRCMAENSPEDA
jgi:hypothetical protein